MQEQTMTQTDFLGQTAVPAKLAQAVIRQIGGWRTFKECAADVAAYGADGGVSGFIYYADTIPFAKRNREAIADLATALADDVGTDPVSLVQGFRCLAGQYDTLEVASALAAGRDDDGSILNALAWFALEETARSYVDLCEA